MKIPVKWYDVVGIIIWVVVLVFIGALAFSLIAEGFLNTGWMFAWIFAAILVIPPVLRSIPVIIARRKSTRGGGSVG